jgi:hypothetical protein
MTVTNNGPSPASGVQATLAFASAPAPFQITVPAGCSYSQPAKKVTCTLGTMASGASQTLLIDDHVLGPGAVNTTATVSSATPDPNPSNNTATNSFFVVPPHPRPILPLLQGLLQQGAITPFAERALTRLVEDADRLVTEGHDRRAYEILAVDIPRDVRRLMADGSVTQAAGDALLLAAQQAIGIGPNVP